MKDPELLPELRFWVANQGVALTAIGNYKPIGCRLTMLARSRTGIERYHPRSEASSPNSSAATSSAWPGCTWSVRG